MAAEILIPAQTAAVTVVKFFSITEDDVPATLMATNLAGSESVPVVFTVDDATTSEAAFQEGTAVTLTATDNVKSINSPGRFGVTKPVTVGVSGVFVSKRENV